MFTFWETEKFAHWWFWGLVTRLTTISFFLKPPDLEARYYSFASILLNSCVIPEIFWYYYQVCTDSECNMLGFEFSLDMLWACLEYAGIATDVMRILLRFRWARVVILLRFSWYFYLSKLISCGIAANLVWPLLELREASYTFRFWWGSAGILADFQQTGTFGSCEQFSQ